MQYFQSLCEQVIQQRADSGSDGHDFIQSLADKIVKLDKNDPDTLTDEHGNLWTRKGAILVKIPLVK